jgi:hypothetical protein
VINAMQGMKVSLWVGRSWPDIEALLALME